MKLLIALGSVFLPLTAQAATGGELGNAFVPFASYYGRFEVEYQKSWQLKDLELAASFATEESYFAVAVDPCAPATPGALLASLRVSYPGIDWTFTYIDGKPAYAGAVIGEHLIFVLRAPGDALTIRLKSGNGEQSDAVIAHMLASLKI